MPAGPQRAQVIRMMPPAPPGPSSRVTESASPRTSGRDTDSSSLSGRPARSVTTTAQGGPLVVDLHPPVAGGLARLQRAADGARTALAHREPDLVQPHLVHAGPARDGDGDQP